MASHNANNERIKRRYFQFLREAKRQSEASVDAAAKAIARFEETTGCRDFRTFHVEQAVAFKRRLSEQPVEASGGTLSKATQYSALAQLKRFFEWLALEPGYRSRVRYSDAEYFNLAAKEARIATARREARYPTIEQIEQVLASMPAESEIQRRNRALVAFTLLTGARDRAIASMKLKHVDIDQRRVYQDARDVQTKFSKTFWTYFFPVGEEAERIVSEWVLFLRQSKQWGDDDPLFPATLVIPNDHRQFQVAGLKREPWSDAAPIRGIFREAFASANLPYFNPHSFRHTLIHLGERVCRTVEEFKAWSQNIGHEGVMTSLRSYGAVGPNRQGEIMGQLRQPQVDVDPVAEHMAKIIARELAALATRSSKPQENSSAS